MAPNAVEIGRREADPAADDEAIRSEQHLHCGEALRQQARRALEEIRSPSLAAGGGREDLRRRRFPAERGSRFGERMAGNEIFEPLPLPVDVEPHLADVAGEAVASR